MKILLVNPPPGRPEVPIYPLGLAYIATALTGHVLRGCDLQLENEPDATLIRILTEFEPDVVAVSIRNVDSSASYDGHSYFPSLDGCIHRIRTRVPSARIVVGGPGFSLFPIALMERLKEVDFGVVFEAERAFPQLLENLDSPARVQGIGYRENGAVKIGTNSSQVDFTTLPAPDRSLFKVADYVSRGGRIGLQTKRGCPFRCVYCTYPFLDGHGLRNRTAAAVADEIQEVLDRGAREFFLCDSIFNVPKGHAESICREIIQRDLDISFFAFFNEAFTDREQLELARDAGCDLAIFGPDGGHSTTLKTYRKGLTTAQLEQAYRWCRELRLPYKCAFLMNGPGETPYTFARMLAFVLRLKLAADLRFSFSTMRIYPHTELHRLAMEKGIVAPDDDLVEPRYYNPHPLKIPCATVSRLGRLVGGVLRRRIVQTPE